tara:strand:- start:33 stop:755 length:723 start_codon:yes stop_codon:yes gene_type:complete
MSSVKGIVLRDNKNIKEISIPKNICTGQLDVSLISGIKNKGYDNIERECDFEWEGDTVSIYAWVNGNESKINQHDMPPPIDKELYYGDILAIRHKDGKLNNFSKDNYNSFYEDSFGGFEDIGSEDEEYSSEDEPTQSDIDFIAPEGDVSEESSSESEGEAVSESEESDEEQDSADLVLTDELSNNENISNNTPTESTDNNNMSNRETSDNEVGSNGSNEINSDKKEEKQDGNITLSIDDK